MRSNEYKKLICEVLENHHLLSLAEIHDYIAEAHFASIYRNVEGLCKEGVLKKIVVDKKDVRYELTSHDHGHFVCNDCDLVEEVDVPNLVKKNYVQVSDVMIRGICKDCFKVKNIEGVV